MAPSSSLPRLLLVLLTGFLLPAAGARADCLQAIFFDLGDTLVEAGGGGLFEVRDGVQATIDSLQATGLQLGIITNVPAGWDREDLEAVMAEPEFLDEFDVVVLSSEAPAPKPNPAIYVHAHGLLPTPVEIELTAFVGENLAEIANAENDPTLGARSVGMVGIWVSDGAPSPLADHTIPSAGLSALVPLHQSLCALFADGFESGDTSAWSDSTG